MKTAYEMKPTEAIMTDGAEIKQYTIKVRDLETGDKPREKMISQGSGALTTAELVAVIWGTGTGTRKEEVMTMAQRLTREYGETTLQHETDPQRLSELLDIPIVKSCQLVAGLELGRRFYQTHESRPVYVKTGEQAYQYVAEIATSRKELMRGIYLNSRYQVVHDEVISIGTLTANLVHPREVFRPALLHGAVAVVVAHNHPSGDPTPTHDDKNATDILRAAGEIMGIELLDHIVVAGTTYYSIVGGKS